MTDFVPIINAPHLSHLVVWINDKGHSETVESPLLCADMTSEPPRIVPLVHAQVPEGAPVRRLLHDSKNACWFDLETGECMREWKACVGPLYSVLDARQRALPEAPPLTTPSIGAAGDGPWGTGQEPGRPRWKPEASAGGIAPGKG